MGEDVKNNRMQRFAAIYGRTHATVRENDGQKWLEVNEPAILGSFVAFCKVSLHSRGRQAYLRGQSRRHLTLVPSLFRGIDQPQLRRRRWAAYRQFLSALPKVVRGTRFTKKNFGAVLQHYGFRTPWLDVVDDLHVAIWFALNNFAEADGECHYQPTTADQGWLVVVSVAREHRVLNLRNRQSSRSVRCHAQQGFSIAMQHDDVVEPGAAQDFMPNVVGTVRIPNTARWLVTGYRASEDYFFPPTGIDDTYRKLLNPKVAEILRESELAHDMKPGTLGSVARYRATDSPD